MTGTNIRNFLYNACPRFLRPGWERLEESTIGLRLARGAFWSIVGASVSRGLMLAASILVARILGCEVYGEFSIIRSTVSMFLVFAGFGLGMTATKHVAEYRKEDPLRAGRIMALSGIFAAVTGVLVATGLFVFAPWLAANTLNAPHLGEDLRIGAFVLLLNALNGAQTGALAGIEAFKAIAIVNLGAGLASFPLLVAGAYLAGLHGAVWALVISMAINWFLNHLALRKEAARFHIPFTFYSCTKELPILWKYSLPAALSGIMMTPIFWICNAMLVNQPGGYAQMGLFDAANQLRIAILFIPGMIGQIVLPMLSSLNGVNDHQKYKQVLQYNIKLNSAAALIIALPVAIFAQFIMRSYGPSFEEGMWTLVFLTFSSVLMAINNVVGQAIASQGRMWMGMWLNTVWAVTLLASSLILLNRGYGALGLALANLIAYLQHSLLQSCYALSVLREKRLF